MHALHFVAPLVFLVVGCSSGRPEVEGHGVADDLPGGASPISHKNNGRIPATKKSELQESAIVVTTYDGKIAVLRASDGAEIARADSGGYGGLIDLSYDVNNGALVAYEENDEGEGAEIESLPLRFDKGAATFGAPTKLAWVDGVARVLALREGTVSFTENIGQRWSIWSASGEPSPSIACPRPASIVVDRADVVTKLIGVSAPFPSEDPPRRIEVSVTENGFVACQVDDLPGAPESARLIQLADGSELVAGIASGKLTLSVAGHRALELAGALDLVASSIEEALLIDGSAGRVAFLLRGPSRVVVIDVQAINGALSIRRAAELELMGEVREEQQFFSREMAALGDRLFVATDTGIEAVDVSLAEGKMNLDLAAFASSPGLNGTIDPTLYRGPVVSLRSE